MRQEHRAVSDTLFWLALGVLVRQRRRTEKLVQGTLADKLGMSQPMISRVEDGTARLDVLTFDRVLEWLGKKRVHVERLANKMTMCLKAIDPDLRATVLPKPALKALGVFATHVLP